MYKTPENFFLRLHFPRSRFSKNLENTLLYLAAKITAIGPLGKDDFDQLLDKTIKETDRAGLKEKTIKNQRTEMIRLFGLAKYAEGTAIPSERLSDLARTQDIPRFFKSFCKRFQYPGGFLKSDRVSELVKAGVRFKPASYILRLLKIGESKFGAFAVNAAEIAHFVFNDKRVTAGNANPADVLGRIIDLREKDMSIDKTSDIIRYARDFLNYMVEANLLNEYKNMYALNKGESKAIHSIISDRDFYGGYSSVIKGDGAWDTEDYKRADEEWMEWFGDAVDEKELGTPASALIKDDAKFPDEWKKIKEILERKEPKARGGALKEIGDEGEKIVYEYEKETIGKIRPDLVRLVKIVSATTTLGYDILSVHPSGERSKKYIEVKTTKKNYESEPTPFFMSINEWTVAEQLGDNYFVYRVIITKKGISVFSIQNPVAKNRGGSLQIEPIAYKIVYSNNSGDFLNLGLGNGQNRQKN